MTMSRTRLCVITALGLAGFSLVFMLVRYLALGDQSKPGGPDTWKVTLVVHGRASGDTRLMTATPLDFGQQHIVSEAFKSDELIAKPPDARYPERREVLWALQPGVEQGAIRAQYEFCCTTQADKPTASMEELARTIYAPPQPGEFLRGEDGIECDDPEVAALARQLTDGVQRHEDQAEALYHYVEQQIASEPKVAGQVVSAAACLQHESGDSAAKSRLLVALLRNRGVPARLVTGLTLARGREQTPHMWVEAFLRDHWMPMCSSFHYYGRLPRTFLVLGFGDLEVVKGKNVRGLAYAYLVEKLPEHAGEEPSWVRRGFSLLSLYSLPPAEQRLVEFLLLLPIAALIVTIFRVVIGLQSFGTFTPALLGLCFRELHTMPGLIVFVAVVLTGWLMRKLLDRCHLLQVPRMAIMLCLVVFILLSAIVVSSQFGMPPTRYMALFPMVILTGMIERFWTLEAEDGTAASFRTLLTTMVMAWTISFILSQQAIVRHMFHYPETIGLIIATQLVLGRYTGYRLTELYRFRDFTSMKDEPPPPPPADPEPAALSPEWGRWTLEEEDIWERRGGIIRGDHKNDEAV